MNFKFGLYLYQIFVINTINRMDHLDSPLWLQWRLDERVIASREAPIEVVGIGSKVGVVFLKKLQFYRNIGEITMLIDISRKEKIGLDHVHI